MNRFDWCNAFVYLKRRRISFAGRPYLSAVYNSTARRTVLRCSRQVEKTTFICNVVLHACVTIPGVRIVVVFPRHDQAKVFAKSRLLPAIMESPAVRRILLGSKPRSPNILHMQFANQSEVYIRAAFHSGDAVRGIDGDYLLIDEYQDIAGGDLPVLEETLSHSNHRRVFLTGTPKNIDNHLEDAFSRSSANEWRVPCTCGKKIFLDEKCLSPSGPICPDCHSAINPSAGLWLPRNPDSTWGAGFTLNHLVTPWLNYSELLEHQQSYDPAQFRNECMGLPSQLGDHIVTRAEVEECCTQRPMARTLQEIPRGMQGQLLAGIDWGGGVQSRTVLVIGHIGSDDHLNILFMERYRAQEDPVTILKAIARRCEEFRVQAVAADGAGNGSVYNPLLLDMLPQLVGLYAMLYSDSDHKPTQYKGRLWNWTIGRTPSLGMVFTRIKTRRVRFPQLDESSSFIDEIWIEMAEYCDHQRSIKYTHPKTKPDDTLHAVNYLATLARYVLHVRLVFEDNAE